MESVAVQYTTTSDGFSIAYAVKGEGTPLVFMPRPFNHLTILSQVASNYAALTALEARFRLIRYDSRGQGLSTRGLPDEVSIEHFALDPGMTLRSRICRDEGRGRASLTTRRVTPLWVLLCVRCEPAPSWVHLAAKPQPRCRPSAPTARRGYGQPLWPRTLPDPQGR
jgi:pimeloyl-ACP methyl ester carboxylesterase